MYVESTKDTATAILPTIRLTKLSIVAWTAKRTLDTIDDMLWSLTNLRRLRITLQNNRQSSTCSTNICDEYGGKRAYVLRPRTGEPSDACDLIDSPPS